MLQCVSSIFSCSGILQPGIKSNTLEVSATFKSYVLSSLHRTACSSLSPRITRLQENGGKKHMTYWDTNGQPHYTQFQNPLGFQDLKQSLEAMSGPSSHGAPPTTLSDGLYRARTGPIDSLRKNNSIQAKKKKKKQIQRGQMSPHSFFVQTAGKSIRNLQPRCHSFLKSLKQYFSNLWVCMLGNPVKKQVRMQFVWDGT